MFLVFSFLLALLISGASQAQTGVVLQNGTPTIGHAAKWCQNGVICDSGSALNGALTEVGITNMGTPFCITDVPVTGTNPYHQLCLGSNSLGGGLISYNSYNGAAQMPLTCNINGVSGTCLNPGGTVVATTPTISGNPSCFGNTGGTLIQNCTSLPLNMANYTNGGNCTGCVSTSTLFGGVLGSASSPETSASPVLIAQKWISAAAPGGQALTAIYANTTKFAPTNGVSQRAIFAEVDDPVGWTGGTLAYSEGIRTLASCGINAVSCFAEGEVAVAKQTTPTTAGFGLLVGVEGEVDPVTRGAAQPFNPNSFAASFLATSGLYSGPTLATSVDAGFMINAHTALNAQFFRGFFCPTGGGAATDAPTPILTGGGCFVTDAPVANSLDAHLAGAGNGNIWLPNNSVIQANNAAGTAHFHMLQVSVTNDILLGFDTGFTSVQIGNSATTIPVEVFNPMLPQFSTPSSSGAACTAGQLQHDTNFVYICTATNTWKRAALATF